MLHIFHDFCFQGLRIFLISTESAENPDDFFSSVMQHHRSVKRKLGDFILMDEPGPKEWFADGLDMMINPAINRRLRKYDDSVIRQYEKRQHLIALLTSHLLRNHLRPPVGQQRFLEIQLRALLSHIIIIIIWMSHARRSGIYNHNISFMIKAKIQKQKNGDQGFGINSLVSSFKQLWPQMLASPVKLISFGLRCANQLIEVALFGILVGQTVHILSSGERRVINLRHLLIKWILYLLVLRIAEHAKHHTILDELFIFLCNVIAAALVYPSQFMKSLHLKYLFYNDKKTNNQEPQGNNTAQTSLFTKLLVSIAVFLLNVLRFIIAFIPLNQRRRVQEGMKEVNLIIVQEKYFGGLYERSIRRESSGLESNVNLYDSKSSKFGGLMPKPQKQKIDNSLKLRAEEHIQINLAAILASEQGRRKFAFYRQIQISYNAESTQLSITNVQDGKTTTQMLEQVVIVDDQMIQLVSEAGQESMFVKFKSKKDKELFINYIYLQS